MGYWADANLPLIWPHLTSSVIKTEWSNIVHLAHTHTQTNVWFLPTNVQYFGGHFRPHNFPKIWHHLCTFPIVSNSSAVSYAWFAIWNALCLGLIKWPGPSQGLKNAPQPHFVWQPFVITSTTTQDVKTDLSVRACGRSENRRGYGVNWGIKMWWGKTNSLIGAGSVLI